LTIVSSPHGKPVQATRVELRVESLEGIPMLNLYLAALVAVIVPLLDDAGRIVREVKVASEPEALLQALKGDLCRQDT
jgi:hypothetical protein